MGRPGRHRQSSQGRREFEVGLPEQLPGCSDQRRGLPCCDGRGQMEQPGRIDARAVPSQGVDDLLPEVLHGSPDRRMARRRRSSRQLPDHDRVGDRAVGDAVQQAHPGELQGQAAQSEAPGLAQRGLDRRQVLWQPGCPYLLLPGAVHLPQVEGVGGAGRSRQCDRLLAGGQRGGDRAATRVDVAQVDQPVGGAPRAAHAPCKVQPVVERLGRRRVLPHRPQGGPASEQAELAGVGVPVGSRGLERFRESLQRLSVVPIAPERIGQVDQRERHLETVARFPRNGQDLPVAGSAGRVGVGVVLDVPQPRRHRQVLASGGVGGKRRPKPARQAEAAGEGPAAFAAVARLEVGVPSLEEDVEEQPVILVRSGPRLELVEEGDGLRHVVVNHQQAGVPDAKRARHSPSPASSVRRRTSPASAGMIPDDAVQLGAGFEERWIALLKEPALERRLGREPQAPHLEHQGGDGAPGCCVGEPISQACEDGGESRPASASAPSRAHRRAAHRFSRSAESCCSRRSRSGPGLAVAALSTDVR